VKEQEFFKERGLKNKPTRCTSCRRKRRDTLKADKKIMDIQCAKCGLRSTSKYFDTENKPMYCPDCYDKMKTGTTPAKPATKPDDIDPTIETKSVPENLERDQAPTPIKEI
jgi:hypothetical protein